MKTQTKKNQESDFKTTIYACVVVAIFAFIAFACRYVFRI